MNHGRPNSAPAAPGLRGNDILYILSRHRWKIILLSLAGIAGAVVVLFLAKPVYVSEADLLVKYIVENRSIESEDSPSAVRTPREDNVVNSEIGILSSMDLAKEVAIAMGPTNIVTVTDPADDPQIAATIAVRKGLEVSARPKSTILNVRFQHGDPRVAKAVLTNLVAAYLKMHARIHRSPDFLNDLQKEAEQRRTALDLVGEELRRIKNELNVSSVDDAKKAYQEEITRTRKEIAVAETLLAEKQAAVAAWTGGTATARPSTNAEAGPKGELAAVAPVTNTIPSEKISEYRNLRIRIEELMRREQNLLLEYTDLSPFVQAVRQRLATNEANLARLVEEFPGLAAPAVASPSARPMDLLGSAVPATPSPALEIPPLMARLASLKEQLEKLRADALKLDEREAELETLTRRKQIEEKRYIHLSTALGQAGIDQALTQGRAANISVIQQPTPPALVQSKTFKMAGGLAVGGIALALGLAFGIEMFLDQSVRRRVQVENALRIPLFLSVPRMKLKAPAKAQKAYRKALPAPARPSAESKEPSPEGAAGAVATVSPASNGHRGVNGDAVPHGSVAEIDEELVPYVEALRDRLIMHFESEGLERKPKLVGLTSCGHGSGVTTLASALAASLSETGDGNVLYVDMNPHRGPSLHPFHRGASKVALAEAFEGETRAAAQVQDNLYVVGMAEAGSRRVGIVPKALAALMPKMKASDYDYIIFDFPPVTQTSVTSKVAGLLDMTFLVLESERTQTDLAKNALALMGEGRAKVTAVLNKHRRYIPQRLDTDL